GSAACTVDDSIVIEYLPNPTIANAPPTLYECDAGGYAIFDLTQNEATILGAQDPADYTVTYYLTEQDAIDATNGISNTTTYTSISDPETVYVRVEDNTTGCSATTSFEIALNVSPIAIQPADLEAIDCDEDQIAIFNLTDQDEVVTGGQAGYTVTYHASQADADAGVNVLVTPYEGTQGQTIYIRRVEDATGRHNTTTSNLVTVDGPTPTMSFTTNFDYEVCPNATVPIIITATAEDFTEADVTITWYQDGVEIPGETSLSLPVLTAGNYEIQAAYNDTGCYSIEPIEIIELAQCTFPQVITPNGDGIHDSFNLSSFNVSKLQIFNSNGIKVYSRNNYSHEFIGLSDNGDELPAGTYFYVMRYKQNEERSAWLYINREK